MAEGYQSPRLRAAPFALAIAASSIVVLWSPYVSRIRGWVEDTFPGRATLVIGGIVAGAVAIATVAALLRIRDRRATRYSAIAAALAFGSTYAIIFRTGDPAVDVVERFHFVEYGLITFFFYLAWRPLGDPAVFVLPALAAFAVGVVDELVQWFIPARVGELHDIFLNGAAIAAGLVFSAGVEPPFPFQRRLHRESIRRVARLSAAFVVTLAAFVSAVHLGRENRDPVGTFRSRYTAQELLALSRDREARWRGRTIAAPPALSREDQYFSEGLWHVRKRNEYADQRDFSKALGENSILEKFFAPVLDTPSYVSATGFRWPPAQRTEAAAHASPGTAGYVSDAEVYPIYLWPQWIFWLIVAGVVAALIIAP